MKKRFARILLGLECLIYKELLDRLALLSLEPRKLKGGLIIFPWWGKSKINGY